MAHPDNKYLAIAENNPLVTTSTRKMSQTGEHYVINTDQQRTGYLDNKANNSDANSNFEKNGEIGREEEEEEKSGFKLFIALSGRRKYTLFLITLAVFLAGVAFSMISPFYPIEAKKKGMDAGTVGIVFGLFELVIFVTAPVFGSYMVELGHRFVLIAGIFVGGCCNILFGTLEYCPGGTPFIAMSLLVRFVEAIGFSGLLTSSFAIVSCEFKDNVGLCYGIMETGSGLGFMLGPVIGGALYELGGFVLPFYVAGIAVLLNGIAIYRYLPLVEHNPCSNRKGSMLTLLRSPMILVPMCSVFLGLMGMTAYETTFANYLERINLRVGLIGVLFGVTALIHTIMSSIWGYTSDAKNIQAPLIVGGNLVFGIGFLLIGPSVFLPFLQFDIVTIVIGLTCIGASFGCALIPTMKCMMIGATELGFENGIATNALVSGLFQSIHNLGGFVGPVVFGYLVQKFDYPITYTVVAMLSFFVMILSLIFFTLRNSRKRWDVTN